MEFSVSSSANPFDSLRPQINRRLWLAGASLLLASPAIGAPARTYDAVVSKGKGTGKRGKAFTSVQAAVDAAPAGSAPYTIRIEDGVYTERVIVKRPNVRIQGTGRDRVTITAGIYAGQPAPDGKAYGTFRTATFEVTAPNFEIHGVSLINSFDGPAESRRPGGLRSDFGGSQQAIALSLSKGSDCAIITDCAIESHQDTLYCAYDRALFVNCLISGSYDFIFGGAAARFEQCEIRSRARTEPVEGYIAAPSTMIDQHAGLVFDRCILTAEPDVPAGSVFLGRPWRAGALYQGHFVGDIRSVGMAAYLHCKMGAHIAPTAWTRMWFTSRDGDPKAMFEPEDARFYEFENTGAGAAGPRRGRALTVREAGRLTRTGMFDDWNPRV